MTNLSQGSAGFFISKLSPPACQKGNLRQPKELNLPVRKTTGGVSLYSKSFITKGMRLYIAKSITNSGREIKCEKCNKYEDLEFHHTKYKNIKIKDIRIRCFKHHRNCEGVKKNRRSRLKTVFENGKRYCEVSDFKFEY